MSDADLLKDLERAIEEMPEPEMFEDEEWAAVVSSIKEKAAEKGLDGEMKEYTVTVEATFEIGARAQNEKIARIAARDGLDRDLTMEIADSGFAVVADSIEVGEAERR